MGKYAMNLKELTPKKTSRLNKVMESRFGFKIDYDNLSYAKAQRLNHAISENLNQIRKSYGIHTAEKNPKYMEMLMVQEGLQEWIDGRDMILEGEMETAETVLAAKDMVDSIQDMITDASKMLNEQLPPLTDTIRDQIGSEQSEVFKGTVGQSLQSLIDTLNQTRSAIDGAARNLTGEGGGDMSSDLGSGMGDMGDMGDMGSDLDTDVDSFAGSDANAGGEETLGRELR
jgi:hypothetical protein